MSLIEIANVHKFFKHVKHDIGGQAIESNIMLAIFLSTESNDASMIAKYTT